MSKKKLDILANYLFASPNGHREVMHLEIQQKHTQFFVFHVKLSAKLDAVLCQGEWFTILHSVCQLALDKLYKDASGKKLESLGHQICPRP